MVRLPSRRSRLQLLLIMGVALSSLFSDATRAWGQNEAKTNKAARMETLRGIPFQEFTPEAQAKLAPVLNRPSVYRRLPIETLECDPDLHVFLVRYPEVIVGIWKLMGVTKVESQRTSDFTLNASDGEGTVSKVELVYGTPGLHIYYAEGYYEGPLFTRKINGRCVLVLRSQYGVDAAGNPVVQNQLDTFLKIDNLAADLVAKTLHPLIGSSADHNFAETSKFMTRIYEAAESNSYGVQAMADRLQDVQPEVRNRFGQIATVVENRSDHRMRASQAQAQPVSMEQ